MKEKQRLSRRGEATEEKWLRVQETLNQLKASNSQTEKKKAIISRNLEDNIKAGEEMLYAFKK